MRSNDDKSLRLLYTKWYALAHRDTRRNAGDRLLCRQWQSFEMFARDVQPPKDPDSILCMIEPEKGFCPGNVRWGTQRQRVAQCRHHERNFELARGQIAMSQELRRVSDYLQEELGRTQSDVGKARSVLNLEG